MQDRRPGLMSHFEIECFAAVEERRGCQEEHIGIEPVRVNCAQDHQDQPKRQTSTQHSGLIMSRVDVKDWISQPSPNSSDYKRACTLKITKRV